MLVSLASSSIGGISDVLLGILETEGASLDEVINRLNLIVLKAA